VRSLGLQMDKQKQNRCVCSLRHISCLRKAVCLMCLCVPAVLGCASPRSYADVLGAIRRGVLLPQDAEYVCVLLLDADVGAPLAGVTITIPHHHHEITLVSDSNGVVRLPLSTELLRDNPPLEHDYSGRIRWIARYTAQGPEEWDRIQYMETSGLPAVVAEGFRIFYAPGCEAAAHKAERKMQEQYGLILKTTGLQPVMWGVVIVPEKDDHTAYVVPPQQGGFPVWCYSRGEVSDGTLDRMNCHEWTESRLDGRLQLTHADGRNRFITDGLAEYLAFLCAGPNRRYLATLLRAEEQGHSSLNLLKRFRAQRGWVDSTQVQSAERWLMKSLADWAYGAGYPLSFVFWYRLCEADGTHIPRQFLGRLKEQAKRDTPACIAVLEEVTGRQRLMRELEYADVSEAIGLIQSLVISSESVEAIPAGRGGTP